MAKVKETSDLMLLIANAVRGDPAYGDDCALYKGFGFVPKSQRRSGLSRPQEATQPAGDADAA